MVRGREAWSAVVHRVTKSHQHNLATEQQQIVLGFPGHTVVKNPPAMQETQVQSLVLEDSLEKEMAAHASILAGEILWTEESGGLQTMRSQKKLDTPEHPRNSINPGWYHIESLKLTTSAKTLYPNQVTIMGAGN